MQRFTVSLVFRMFSAELFDGLFIFQVHTVRRITKYLIPASNIFGICPIPVCAWVGAWVCVFFFSVRVCACACMCVLCHLVNTSEGYVFMLTLAIALLEEFMSYLTAPS